MRRCIRSLQQVTERVGHAPSVDEYKQSSAQMRASGEDVETFARLYKHFDGNWSRVREALELSGTTTARRIDARFRYRKVGKVWRFTEGSLRAALTDVTAHYGRPPTVAEFEWWREHQLELAKARGDDALQLPSSSPYRRRYKTWEAALLHFGYTPAEVEQRLDARTEFKSFDADAHLPEGLPIAELAPVHAGGLSLTDEQLQRVRAAYEALPRRSRYVLTARLGLGIEPLTLTLTAKPLGLQRSRIHQLQGLALDSLGQAAAGEGRDRPDLASLRHGVEEALRALARGV